MFALLETHVGWRNIQIAFGAAKESAMRAAWWRGGMEEEEEEARILPLPPCSSVHPFYPPISGINSCSIINESNGPTGNALVWHVFQCCSPDFEKIMGNSLVNPNFIFLLLLTIL